jgi:hypothetical protein
MIINNEVSDYGDDGTCLVIAQTAEGLWHRAWEFDYEGSQVLSIDYSFEEKMPCVSYQMYGSKADYLVAAKAIEWVWREVPERYKQLLEAAEAQKCPTCGKWGHRVG